MNDAFVSTPIGPAPRPPSRTVFVIAGVLMMALLVLLSLWVGLRRENSDQARLTARASYNRMLFAREMLIRLNEAESAQRGYVIAGKPAFLEPYGPARRALLQDLPQLATMYRHDAAQLARVHELRGAITAKLREMDEVIRHRETGGLPLAAARVSDNKGRLLMERARAIVSDLTAAEDRARVASIARVDATALRVRQLLQIMLLIVGVVALVSLVLSWQARKERYRTGSRAHESLMRLRAVFASTTDAIVILNPSGTIEDINAAATRMLGFEPHEIARRDVSRLLTLTESDGPFEKRIGLVDGEIQNPIRVDQTVRHRDGHPITVDVALGLMPTSEGVHIVASLRDVSERRAAERLKDDFISTVSHELRTPLTSVLGSLGLLRGGAAGTLTDKAQRLIDIADNNARRLIRLINDILDIDRISSGESRLDMAVIDIQDVARRAIEDARGLGAANRVRFELTAPDGPLPVLADADRLRQVLGNLLSNAIRFSPTDGMVTLDVTREARRVSLRVSDSGPGVPPEFRNRLFERFSQSSAGAAIPGGSGLGLTISREIVRAHGGDIWFEEAPGGGASFCVWLALHIAPAPVGDLDRPRVLVCEDDPDAAAVLREMIEQEGFVVDLSGSAREAQAMVSSGDYAGVILDLRLPDASGLAAVRALRAAPATRAVPIIVVSGAARDGEQEAEANILDVVDWIDKPVEPERLLRALDRAIRRSSDDKPTLLHIDDDPDMLDVTAIALAGKGNMLRAESLARARAVLAATTPDVVILDVNLSDGSGLDLLPDLFAANGNAIPTIIYSAAELTPQVGRQFDAVLVKSRRSLRALSGKIGEILDRRHEEQGERT